MKVAVWDTYVTKKDNTVMHFDIIAPEEIKDPAIIHQFGKKYLKEKGQEGQPLTANECKFCHVETPKPLWENSIRENGFFIYEMDNCN
jgi:Domain of unknown function (DUF2024).